MTVRKSSYRSIRSLQRDNARCRACVEAVAAERGIQVQTAEYGMHEIELVDPDGNRLRLGTPVPA